MSVLDHVALALGYVWLALIALTLVYVLAFTVREMLDGAEKRYRRSRERHYAQIDRIARNDR